jgi:two-component system NarL family response regulator
VKIRIVLADDHRMLREALRAVLEKEPDIEVVGEAADGHATLQLARKLAPDVVVLDVAMPELSGIDAMSQLASHHPKIRVVALSAYSDRRYVLEMLRAGAAGYVVKAAAGTELLRAIRAVASGRNYLCPEVAGTVIDDVKHRDNPASHGLAALGRREREILQLIAEGQRSSAIAKRLFISVATVDTHRRNIMRKLDLHTVAQLTKYAIREGLSSA